MKYLWISVPLDRLMGLSPLLCRLGPMMAFSKAQTIFSRLLALCLFGMALVGVAAEAVTPLLDAGTDVSDSTTTLGNAMTTEFSCRRWLSKVSEPVDWPPVSMVCWA